MLDINTLENWLWEAACKIRGAIDAPKYKDYILPLIFFKRLSDVFEDEMQQKAKDFGDRNTAEQLVEADHNLVWFYLPPDARWSKFMTITTKLGEYLTDSMIAIARENPKLNEVINSKDFNETSGSQRIIDDDQIDAVRGVLNRHKLGLSDVEPDILGRAYEYLLRMFAEGAGKAAGEFYTPREVAILMARMLDPKEGEEIYDPCLGSGGLLIKSYLRFKEKYGDDPQIKPVKLYGQEMTHTTLAMAKMNSFIYRMDADLAVGNTMTRPAFVNPDGSMKKFDIVIANPMWNQGTFNQATYENDVYERFPYGFPPNSSADWGWIQHMYKSLKPEGKMAVILDTGALSRGSSSKGSDKERDIRKAFVDNDMIEAVLLLPENLFYNTTAPGVIIFINKVKKHKDQILLINGSKLFEKGRPKNFLTDNTIEQISKAYLDYTELDSTSKIISNGEIVKNDYNIAPSRYVAFTDDDTTLPLEEAWLLVKEAEEEREIADTKLKDIMIQLGV